MVDLNTMGQEARAASVVLARAGTAQKNAALTAMADALEREYAAILEANQQDLTEGRANGMSEALLDRLDLQRRLDGIISDVRKVIKLPDPVGQYFDARVLENGLRVSRRRTPIGVLGVIYESRPNVTVDVAALALKSGNAVILRGGKETLRSNMALVKALQVGLNASGLPRNTFQYVASPDRQYVADMLKMHRYIDMIIPRGGNALHQFCRENSTIPVITGGLGVCHLFVDESADIDASLDVIHNAKTQRPAACNSLDTALVHQSVAAEVLPRIVSHLSPAGVTFRAEPNAMRYVRDCAGVEAAGPEDFDTEWMTLVLGLKVVTDLNEAIEHIRQHSTQHSDGILTRNMDHANQFLDEVDSAAVYVNASTRFTDGSALGLGAEIAVSTQKLHARGPMALEELTIYKWVIIGDGHVRA